MELRETKIDGVVLLKPQKFGDHRGFFSETYNKKVLLEHGIDIDFVQDNHSLSANRSTLRGLHFQAPPFGQDKLVRVLKGAILDVAVDLRSGSPTYGEHVIEEVSAEEWNQILVPCGFAHGFITTEENTEVAYKVSNYYSASHVFGIKWDDPDLGIDWGVSEQRLTISDKDKAQPLLKDITTPF